MPDQRQHRGPNPRDAEAFAPEMLPRLRAACADLCWLLSRGYAEKSAGTLVGDRHALTERQRIAVRRCACSDEQLHDRQRRQITDPAQLAGATLEIDGYNVLTTVEAALAGGVILVGRDGSYRDMASMHGNFKKVAETPKAIALIGRTLARCGARALWYLDAPVSNSARLKQLILEIAGAEGWDWQVELVPDPDRVLAISAGIVATADSAILDAGPRWVSLAREVVCEHVADPWIVSFADPAH